MITTAPAPFRFTFEHVATRGQPPHEAYIYRYAYIKATIVTGATILICDTYGEWHFEKIAFTMFARGRTDVMFAHPPHGECFPIFVE